MLLPRLPKLSRSLPSHVALPHPACLFPSNAPLGHIFFRPTFPPKYRHWRPICGLSFSGLAFFLQFTRRAARTSPRCSRCCFQDRRCVRTDVEHRSQAIFVPLRCNNERVYLHVYATPLCTDVCPLLISGAYMRDLYRPNHRLRLH